MIKLETSTRLAFQAAIAVAAAVLVGYVFHWERSYWAILTAMLLISQTWGESIKKSFERVSMTILGGIVGTILYFLVAKFTPLVFIILMMSIFFNVYFTGRSYLFAIFFTTILVVFLFANLNDWTVAILEERILETITGAVIAVITTAFVFPMRGYGKLPDLLSTYIKTIIHELNQSIDIVLMHQQDKLLKQRRISLYKQFITLRQRVKLISYELFFTLYSRARLKKIMLKIGTLVHYTTNIMEVADELDKNLEIDNLYDDIISAREIVFKNLNTLQELLLQEKTEQPFIALTELLPELQSKTADYIKLAKVHKSHWFNYLSFFYYLKKLNETIGELMESIQHVKKDNKSV